MQIFFISILTKRKQKKQQQQDAAAGAAEGQRSGGKADGLTPTLTLTNNEWAKAEGSNHNALAARRGWGGEGVGQGGGEAWRGTGQNNDETACRLQRIVMAALPLLLRHGVAA